MSHPLDGPRLKVRRAKSEIDAYLQVEEIFVTTHQYQVVPAELNPKTQKRVYRAVAKDLPPPEWGVWIGEIAHNLRSALDGLVYQLALLSNAKASTRTSQFPIFLNRRPKPRKGGKGTIQGFESRDRGGGRYMIQGLRPDHQAVLERLQPYKRGRGSHRNALYLLHEINNADKHRLLQVMGIKIGAISFGDWADTTDDLPFRSKAVKVLKNGTKLGEAGPGVAVKPNLTPLIAFWEGCDAVHGLTVYPTLRRIAEDVSGIVEGFAPDFP